MASVRYNGTRSVPSTRRAIHSFPSSLTSVIVTAGGVAFMSGTIDYYVRAYDVTTGEQLWEDRLPAGGQATPMTYLDSQGRQRLLVVAGGHGSLGTKAGDAIIAYGLKDD